MIRVGFLSAIAVSIAALTFGALAGTRAFVLAFATAAALSLPPAGTEQTSPVPRIGVIALDAIFVGGDTIFLQAMGEISQMVREVKLPALFPYPEYHEHEALISYGPSMKEVGRRAARYVDEILKGAKPSELPIEQISTYKLIVDLRVARALNLKVPHDLLLRADELIR